jgi:DNA-binding MarR family transcriptional regulator
MAVTPSSVETAELMFGCFKRMRRLVDAELSECGLSLSRTKILSELSHNGPVNQSSLATTFDLAPRTMTELVDTLERDGLVERKPDPADRRARHVHLTPAGDQAQQQAAAVRKRLIDRVLGTLNDQQRDGLATALRLIEVEIDRIDADNGSVGGGTEVNCAP